MPGGTRQPLARVRTGSAASEKNLDGMQASLDGTLPDILRNGRLLTGTREAGITFVAATAQDVAHGLGRTYRGWWVVRDFGTNASALREDAAAPAGGRNRFLRLVSTVDATVHLWVF